MTGIAIARGLPSDRFLPALEAARKGGFRFLEITMNTAGAAQQIRRSRAAFGDQAVIGAGTVVSKKDLETALEAGAQFIVCPDTNPEIINACVGRKIPVYPGALTPTEVLAAYRAGATMVKVFPVSSLGGPSYIKDLKAPLNEVPLLACGGVSADNIREFRKAGADGFACGGSLFLKRWIDDGDFMAIETACRAIFESLGDFH